MMEGLLRDDEPSTGLYDTYKRELELWGAVNRQLKQHGLRHVLLADPNQLLQSNDVVGFSSADSESLRENYNVLMKDGDRRQSLIQDLILTNNQLRSDLESRDGQLSRLDMVEQEERNRLLRSQLNDANNRVQELEVMLEQQKELSLQDSEREVNTKQVAQARVHQLEKRCDLQEVDLERLRSKLSSLDAERERRERRVQDVFHELRRGASKGLSSSDKRILDVIDMYESDIADLKRRLSSLQDRNSPAGEVSTDSQADDRSSERTNRYKELIKSFNKDLRLLEKELKQLREKNELLELELQSRPHLDDYNRSKQKIRELERVLQEHSISLHGKNVFNKKAYSTKVEDIDFIPLTHCRNYLHMVCESLELSDLKHLESTLSNHQEAVAAFPKLEELVLHIADVVEPSLARNHMKNKHKIWCSKHWKNIVTRLETWRQQIKQLPELSGSVARLLQQYDRPKDALASTASVSEIAEAVESITSKIPPANSQPLLEEKVSHAVLLSMVKHFQHLFDVPSMSGMYPRMNEIYTRYNELKNVQRTLAELLDLGDGYKGSDIVDAVGRVCQSYTSSTYKQLKQLLQEDELDSVIERLDEHRKFMPLFRDVLDHLMDILDVERIDQVVPSVRALKLMIS
ncbi:centrosomal protein of 70 kDa-like [Watersipora subatra]|uniref:centrosomal protein of 70 kDa-like n=1 Tax=Watersipora subatra TaxID=2589382 RepID=UPI00355BE0C9